MIRVSQLALVAILIAFTGWGSEEDKRQTEAAGFNHHLTKPVEVEQTESILARVAATRKPGSGR